MAACRSFRNHCKSVANALPPKVISASPITPRGVTVDGCNHKIRTESCAIIEASGSLVMTNLIGYIFVLFTPKIRPVTP